MKKFLIFLLVIFFILVLEIIFKYILPFYFQPNLWLPYIVFIALFLSHSDAVIFGLFLGAVYDVLHLTIFGTNMFLFSTVGYFIGWFNKNMNEKLHKVQILALITGCLVYYFSIALLILFKLTNYHLNILYALFSVLLTVLIGYLEIQILYRYYEINFLL